MSVFTFTVNCPASPTPTPTPRPTPCPCDSYSIENVGGAPRTVFYTDCRGISRSIPVGSGVLVEICACSVSPETNIVITNLGACGTAPTATPTPTPTATPTPTPTFPPTPTVLPMRTISVYAKVQAIPNGVIAPGSGAETAVRVYYTADEGPLTLIGGNVTSTSCNLVGTISVRQGTVLSIGMLSWSYNTPVFFVPNLGSSSCTTTGTRYCGTSKNLSSGVKTGGGYSFTVTGDTSIALTALTIVVQYRREIVKYQFKKIKNYKDYVGSTYFFYEDRTTLYYCDGWSPLDYAK
jgi:hypothetical protein